MNILQKHNIQLQTIKKPRVQKYFREKISELVAIQKIIFGLKEKRIMKSQLNFVAHPLSNN